MSKILVVGNSLVAAKTIEEIRQKDQQSEIALFCTESLLPYDRLMLPGLLAGEVKESKLHPLPDNFFKQNRVEVIANEKLLRISFKRKYLTTESKAQLGYDELYISDLGSVEPLSIKGHQKKGVFDCTLLSSVKGLMKYLPYTDMAFVLVSNFQGFNTACALHGLGKEVTIVTSDSDLLSAYFDQETSALLKQIVEGKGIRVMTSNTIEEILGDSEIKAVRLQSGKVVAAQMVVADSLPFDWRLLEEATNFQKVEDDHFSKGLPLQPTRFGFKVVDGYCTGITKLPREGREYLKFDGPQNIFKKIYVQGDRLVGAVLFNASSYEGSLFKTIMDSSSIEGREEALIGG